MNFAGQKFQAVSLQEVLWPSQQTAEGHGRIASKQAHTSVLLRTKENRHKYFAGTSQPIMAWELMNEPRCSGDFSASKLQHWIERTAEFLKSVDPNHLVTVGTEGFFGSSTPGEEQSYTRLP